jgi:hypothetical protein
LLAQDWGQAADLCSKGRTHVLRAVRYQVLYCAHDLTEEGVPVDQGAEARDLASNGRPHLGLVVLEQFYKGGNQIPSDNFLVNCLGDLHFVSLLPKQKPMMTS